MSATLTQQTPEKPFAVAVLRIGTHPIVYSVMVMIALGVAFFFLAIVPYTRQLQAGGTASVTDARNRNMVAANSLTAQKKLVSMAASLTAADRGLLAHALPTEEDAPGLAVILKSIAVRSGVKMSSIDVAQSSQSAAAGATQSVVRLQVTEAVDLVTYDKLKILLTNTENSLRLFDLKSLTYSPTTGSVNLQFDTYYLSSP